MADKQPEEAGDAEVLGPIHYTLGWAMDFKGNAIEQQWLSDAKGSHVSESAVGRRSLI